MINVIVRCCVLVFLVGPQVLKTADIYQEMDFFVMKQKPLLKPRSHCFGHDCNLSKHVLIAFATFLAMRTCFDQLKCWEKAYENKVSSQKRPKKSKKTCLEHGKRSPKATPQ